MDIFDDELFSVVSAESGRRFLEFPAWQLSSVDFSLSVRSI